MKHISHGLRALLTALTAGIAAFIAGCTATPTRLPGTPPPDPHQITAPRVSGANNPLAYRHDAASHLYSQNAHRIFQGKLPAQLYAIGVLQVEVNSQGLVTSTQWMRAPQQAPEVVTEIERTVRQAAPFPIPVRMGHVTYTDVWLWDKSGQFQLDTLTEGQL